MGRLPFAGTLRSVVRYAQVLLSSSGIDSTYEVELDLAPAMRMALGAEQATDFSFEWERFKWLRQAWGKAEEQTDLSTFSPPDSIILDGELLVYDEGSTMPGLYDELGSSPGVVSFGTHFWLSVNPDPETNQPVGGKYSRYDCQRHYLVKVFDLLHLNGRSCEGLRTAH